MQISVSLLATRDEIGAWLAYQAVRFDLYFALVHYQPEFELVPLTEWTEHDRHKDHEGWREIWVGLGSFNTRYRSHLDCVDKHPNRLVVQLPEQRPLGLREGSLATLSQDEEHLRVWRSIIRYFRKQTTAGAWVVNPAFGTKGYYKNIRYSPGIAALHRAGLHLLPFAGGNQVFIDEPDVATPITGSIRRTTR